MWKFKSLKGRDKWIFLLTIGAVLCILAFPADRVFKTGAAEVNAGTVRSAGSSKDEFVSSREDCETALESRVRSVLEHVEGIGRVDVMIVQGTARTDSVQTGASLFGDLTGSGTAQPQENASDIQGIIISAEGGGSPVVQAEICEAMEALFGLPAHKIKVLKRVE